MQHSKICIVNFTWPTFHSWVHFYNLYLSEIFSSYSSKKETNSMLAAVLGCIKAWIDPFILCSEDIYFSDKVHSQNRAFLYRALQVCIISK